MINAIVLTAGGLDSILVCKLMEQTNISFEVVHFDIGLTYNKPIVAGQRISKYFGLEDLVKNRIEIKKFDVAKEFYSQILNIRDFTEYNACIQQKIFILKKAKSYMQEINAQFIVTGDVLDQRLMIQGKNALSQADQEAGVANLVFRPLSAKILPINNHLLNIFPPLEKISYDFKGFDPMRHELAKNLQIVYTKSNEIEDFQSKDIELNMSKKAFEIFEKQKPISLVHLNRVGVHFKLDKDTRFVLGRTNFESHYLKHFYETLNKKGVAFSVDVPKFLFGFIYEEKSTSDVHNNLAFEIFNAYLPENNTKIQLFDHEGFPLGGVSSKQVFIENIQKYILHTNEVFCPISTLDIK